MSDIDNDPDEAHWLLDLLSWMELYASPYTCREARQRLTPMEDVLPRLGDLCAYRAYAVFSRVALERVTEGEPQNRSTCARALELIERAGQGEDVGFARTEAAKATVWAWEAVLAGSWDKAARWDAVAAPPSMSAAADQIASGILAELERTLRSDA